MFFKKNSSAFITFKINDKLTTFEELDNLLIDNNLNNSRIEVYIKKKKEEDIELGNLSYIREMVNDIPRYVFSVNTKEYFWQMGIATMVISFSILLLMRINNENDFSVYAQLQKEAKKIMNKKNISVYHNVFDDNPSYENDMSVTQFFPYDNRDIDKVKFCSLFKKNEEYLIEHYNQIKFRNYNEDVMYKCRDEIEQYILDM